MSAAAERYLELLSPIDLALLDEALGGPGSPDRFREQPAALPPALASEAAFSFVFGDEHQVAAVSPLLLFSVMVHRGATEVATSGHVTERVAGRMLVPVFDSVNLAAFAADEWNQLFLVELLGSFTKVASGARYERRGGRLRKRKFSELDPASLAELVRSAPPAERPGIWRRMGDLALFTTGVFPDHAIRQTLGPLDLERIVRSIPRREQTELLAQLESFDALDPLLRALGPRWYRLTAEQAMIPGAADFFAQVADRFDAARRFLAFVSDRYLFNRRTWLFPWQN